MDVSDVIARREFMPTYIRLDVAFLIGFAALLVWRRKYMTLLVGLVMGGVYFAVDYGAFNLLTHSRSISGGSMFWVLLWMSVSYGFTNFSWLWLWLSRDRHLAEWSMLILVWVVLLPVDVADVYGPVRVRHAADCHPTHDRRVPRGGWPSSCRAGVWSVMRRAADRHGYLPIRLGTVEDIRNT